MITNTKIALAAAFLLGAASVALANDVETNPREGTFTCPTLEGYPDCHPDGRASWTLYSTTGEVMAQKRAPQNSRGMRRER